MRVSALHYFLAVVATGSVRGAAERLHISASSISRQIQSLEHEFGVVLFERKQSGLRPTQEGRALETHFRRITREFDAAQAKVVNLRQLIAGRVSFCTIEGAAHYCVFPAINSFREAYPRVSFEGQILGSDAVVEAVAQERVDFGIAMDPDPAPWIELVAEFGTQFVVLLSPNHPLAGASELRLEELQPHDLSLLDQSFYTRRWLTQSIHAQGLSFRVHLELDQIDALIAYISLSGGITVLPDYAITPAARALGLQVARIAGEEPPSTKTAIFVNKRHRMTSATERFLEYVKSAAC